MWFHWIFYIYFELLIKKAGCFVGGVSLGAYFQKHCFYWVK